MNVCKYIVNLDEDKNPADKDGRTPLHMASYNHNGAICEFITELAEKNPEDLYGRTSLKQIKWGQRKMVLWVITTKANWGLYVHYLTISFTNTKVHCSRNVRPTIPLFNLVFSNARTSWRSQQIIKGAALISMQRCTTNFSRKTKVM